MNKIRKTLFVFPIALFGLLLTSCEGIPYITKDVFLDQFNNFYSTLIDSDSDYQINNISKFTKNEEIATNNSFSSTYKEIQFNVDASYLRVATYSRNDSDDATESFTQIITSLYKNVDENGTAKYYEVCYQHWPNKDQQLHKQYKIYDKNTFDLIFNERIQSVKNEIKSTFINNYEECEQILNSGYLFDHDEYDRTSYDASYFGQDEIIKAMLLEEGHKEVPSKNKKKQYANIDASYNIKIDGIHVVEKEVTKNKKEENESYYLYENYSMICSLKYIDLGAEAYSSISIEADFDKQ